MLKLHGPEDHSTPHSLLRAATGTDAIIPPKGKHQMVNNTEH